MYSDHGYIYRYSVTDNNIEIEHKFTQGMNNPLSFSSRYDGNKLVDLLYGEYMWNKTKEPVSIYRRTDGNWNKVFSFPTDTISHIHNIFFDKFKNRYIILTGDDDSESGIWEADINFEYVRPIIKGLQKYRACIAYPTKDAIYYATDTPLEQNYLYKLTESNEEKYLKKSIKCQVHVFLEKYLMIFYTWLRLLKVILGWEVGDIDYRINLVTVSRISIHILLHIQIKIS